MVYGYLCFLAVSLTSCHPRNSTTSTIAARPALQLFHVINQFYISILCIRAILVNVILETDFEDLIK